MTRFLLRENQRRDPSLERLTAALRACLHFSSSGEHRVKLTGHEQQVAL